MFYVRVEVLLLLTGPRNMLKAALTDSTALVPIQKKRNFPKFLTIAWSTP